MKCKCAVNPVFFFFFFYRQWYPSIILHVTSSADVVLPGYSKLSDSSMMTRQLVSIRIKYSPILPSVYRSFLNSLEKDFHCPSLSCVISSRDTLNSVSAFSATVATFLFSDSSPGISFQWCEWECRCCAMCASDVRALVLKRLCLLNNAEECGGPYCDILFSSYFLRILFIP